MVKSKSLLFRSVIIFILVTIELACQSSSDNTNRETSLPKISYDSFLQNLKIQKETIDTGDMVAAKSLLFETINTNVPKYWIGTPWDFNGTTQSPQSGHIACGYFLTTTMKQTGYDIKRVWMAQQASSVLIKAYCKDIKIASKLSVITDYLRAQPDSSCFIIGLDYHTGFVTKNGSELYIIHSNYIGNEGVIKEKIETSAVLENNSYFMIGSLSKREDHLRIWMTW